MDMWMWGWLLLLAGWWLKQRDERRRIAWLGSVLQPYGIEKLMAQLNDGYQRALAETDPQRQQAIWTVLEGPERELAQQVTQVCTVLAQWPEAQRRMSRRPWPLGRLWPHAGTDFAQLMQVHANGLRAAQSREAASDPKRRAHRLLAEMLLLQHSCHWYCRSQAVASARLWARHRTRHEQVLQAVAPETCAAYHAVLKRN